MQHSARPKLKEFARRLFDETAGPQSIGESGSIGFPICEKLRPPLVRIMGIGGFLALFKRALALAQAQVPWLATLEVKADGCVAVPPQVEAKLGSTEMAAGEVALIAELIELLVTFIGPTLTLGLIQEAWPKADFSQIDFGDGEKI